MVLNNSHFRFGAFRVDVPGRRLWKNEELVELNGRYFDALVLLLREQGQLISKERFFQEIWSGVIVSDSALTQCIKEIRRQLGDDATAPRYVETVPRYGYRFIGEVVTLGAEHSGEQRNIGGATQQASTARKTPATAVAQSISGALGGGAAGLLGGLLYGSIIAGSAAPGGAGTTSTLLVMMALGLLIGAAGGSGVSAGIAASGQWARHRSWWMVIGSALGGFPVGGLADLLCSDGFSLLFGRAPEAITGALEGVCVGGMLGTGLLIGGGVDADKPWKPLAGAAVTGSLTGALVPLAGGQLFAGSLKNLLATFTGSRLRLDALGQLLGDQQLGAMTQAILGGAEILLFNACVAGAMIIAHRLRRS